jgi:Fe-S-cluster containining protein
MKFKCSGCATCCKTLGQGEQPKRRQNGFVKILDAKGLPLFGWEHEKLKKLAGEKGIKADFRPSAVVFDKDGKALIISYILKGPLCPFLNDGRCIIYEDRPLRCRAYPLEANTAGSKTKWSTHICPQVPEEMKGADIIFSDVAECALQEANEYKKLKQAAEKVAVKRKGSAGSMQDFTSLIKG